MGKNIYSVKYDGWEAAIIADNILEAIGIVLLLTDVDKITSAKLVYTEEEARTK